MQQNPKIAYRLYHHRKGKYIKKTRNSPVYSKLVCIYRKLVQNLRVIIDNSLDVCYNSLEMPRGLGVNRQKPMR